MFEGTQVDTIGEHTFPTLIRSPDEIIDGTIEFQRN